MGKSLTHDFLGMCGEDKNRASLVSHRRVGLESKRGTACAHLPHSRHRMIVPTYQKYRNGIFYLVYGEPFIMDSQTRADPEQLWDN